MHRHWQCRPALDAQAGNEEAGGPVLTWPLLLHRAALRYSNELSERVRDGFPAAVDQ
jgi:hypothetical protein